MPSAARPVALEDQLRAALERIEDLERRVLRTMDIPGVGWALAYSWDGPLETGEAPVVPLWRTGRLLVVRFQPQEDPGSTATTLAVKRNGTALTPLGAGSTTITLPGSSSSEVSVRFGGAGHVVRRYGNQAADQFTLEILTVGTGASGLTALADFADFV